MIDPALRFDNGYNWYSFTAFLKPYLNENNITPTQLAITAAVAIGADNEIEAKGLAGNLATAPAAYRAKVAKQLADLYHRDAKSQAAWAEYQSSRSKVNNMRKNSLRGVERQQLLLTNPPRKRPDIGPFYEVLTTYPHDHRVYTGWDAHEAYAAAVDAEGEVLVFKDGEAMDKLTFHNMVYPGSRPYLRKNRSNPHSRSNGMTAFRMNGRRNPSDLYTMPPRGYTYMMEDDLDENYEIAMSEDGIMAYKIISRVNNQGAKLPDGFYPGSAMVVVAFDGNVYSVRLVDAEDVQQRTLANRIPTAKDAELRAKDELVKMNASSSGSGRSKRKI